MQFNVLFLNVCIVSSVKNVIYVLPMLFGMYDVWCGWFSMVYIYIYMYICKSNHSHTWCAVFRCNVCDVCFLCGLQGLCRLCCLCLHSRIYVCLTDVGMISLNESITMALPPRCNFNIHCLSLPKGKPTLNFCRMNMTRKWQSNDIFWCKTIKKLQIVAKYRKLSKMTINDKKWQCFEKNAHFNPQICICFIFCHFLQFFVMLSQVWWL